MLGCPIWHDLPPKVARSLIFPRPDPINNSPSACLAFSGQSDYIYDSDLLLTNQPLGGPMTLLVRDDKGVLHPVHDATQNEIDQLARRAWQTNWQKAEEIGMLPEPIYGLQARTTCAA
jgi:hypothetical protein